MIALILLKFGKQGCDSVGVTESFLGEKSGPLLPLAPTRNESNNTASRERLLVVRSLKPVRWVNNSMQSLKQGYSNRSVG